MRDAEAFAVDFDPPNSFARSRRLAAKMQLQEGHFIDGETVNPTVGFCQAVRSTYLREP